MILFIFQNYVNFQKFSLILNKFLVYFFGKLPTITSYRVTYSRKISLKIKIIHYY